MFKIHVGGIIHGEKLFGRCCGRSTRLKRILHETLQIIPEALRHLPGEGEILPEGDPPRRCYGVGEYPYGSGVAK